MKKHSDRHKLFENIKAFLSHVLNVFASIKYLMGIRKKEAKQSSNIKKKILMVDDEKNVIEIFSIIFDEAGYDVSLASNGEEALALFKKGAYDLVITDIKMPGMDGIQLLMEIRKIDSAIDVIILTGYGDVETYNNAMSLGAAEYINKPVRIKQFERIVKKYLYN